MTSLQLSDRDVQAMLKFTATDGHDGPGWPLPWSVLRDLSALVPCDQVSISGQDTPRWEFFADQDLTPYDDCIDADALEAAYRSHYWESTCSYADRTGDIASVVMFSDFHSERDRRNSPMYAEFGRPLGIEHEVIVCFAAGGPRRTLRLLFSRGEGPAFTERDRAVLTLLRPHLQRMFTTAMHPRARAADLTARQREIMSYVAAGDSNRLIGRRLQVSEGTVRKHLENIFERLQVTSRTAAVVQVGVVPEADSRGWALVDAGSYAR